MKPVALAGVFLLEIMHVAFAYETLQGPTETRYWDESRAYNGYTLFGARGTSYLIDMEGRVVRTWPVGTNPRFLENGNLLDASTDDPSHGAGFTELDWNGNAVWEYYEDRDDYEPHHDFVRIFNTNLNAYTTLYIANKTITQSQAIAAGCDPADGPYDGSQADAVVEVDMAGNVVWEWWFFDHTVQDFDPTRSNYIASVSNAPGRLNVNLPGRPVKKDWLHCNALDYNAELDQIVINSVQGEFYVIDHGATFVAGDPAASIALAASAAGDFLYRFGDPARYAQGDAPYIQEDWTQSSAGHKQIGGSHDIQWIKPDLPGAGHFLVFNNGQYLWERCPQSYIVEINGFLNAAGVDTGGYVNPPNAGYTVTASPNKDTHKQTKYISKQIAWMYYSKSNQGFFSHIGSSAQRLANTNTLICAMTEGHIFEVTSDGELVWEYINPVTPDGKLERIDDNWPMYNSMFRAYRYTADHPALAGRDLTPGDTISGATPAYTYIPDTNDVPPTVISTWSMLALPDTGQIGDYAAAFGEDSDYAIHPPAYAVNGDGTLSDDVTGLMWQQTDGGEMTWAAAVAYATNLALGSHNDWRLPTSHELFSIVNHGQASLALDTNAFIATAAQYWWTSDTQADDPSRVWVVNAGGGIGAHPTNETLSAGGSKRFHVRCVRDPSGIASSNMHAFTVSGDGTVTDENTSLVWQQTAVTTATWEAALTYAESLALGGHVDWRLPNIKELRSISDDRRSQPSLDATVFPEAIAAPFWSSTTEVNQTNRAWTVDFRYGLVSYESKTSNGWVRCVRGGTTNAAASTPEMVALDGGTYEMGDHHDLGGGEHANDEIPIHTVNVSAFQIGAYETRCDQYVDFLNAAMELGAIDVRTGLVYRAGTEDLYCETRAAVPHSRIGWDGARFSVLDGREAHPATGIRWSGAAAYCNWLSEQTGRDPCYDLASGACDFPRNGFRLPTEAEWEFAGRGGLYAPYCIYPWGDDADSSRANWPGSGDPFEAGDYPLTTPAGFYDGSVRQQADWNWPAATNQYATMDGANAYGLHDMAGNVWEWVNDWYGRDYYADCVSNNIVENPPGPSAGTPAPDGQPYHALRGGNWYNGEQGHSRVSNRNLAYYRGPDDPNHAWYHVGFRIARGAWAAASNAPPVISGTSRSPLLPTSADPVWVTASVSDDESVSQVALTYRDGGGTATVERTAFSETMRAVAVKPWTGDGCDHAWTVTASLADNVEQRTGANYGTGNACGVEFHRGTTNLTDTMIATTAGISATGTSGYVEFWIQALTLTNSQGWTLQLDSGSGYVTRLSELTGSSHAWQQYHYALAPSEMVDGLKLRFQFRGGDGDPRVDLDQISVTVSSAGGGTGGATIAMLDDGAHQDGRAGDHRYGGEIPARPAGTTVAYFIAATDGEGAGTTDPAGAPDMTYSYTVLAEVTNRTVGLITNTPAAFAGYTLLAPKHYTNTYLLDNEGQMVHSWTSGYVPGQSAYLLTNGNLLRSCFIQGGGLTGGGEGGRLEEYTWDGARVWELDFATANYAQHHDICPLPNGNVLMLVVERKTYAEVLQAGFNPSLLHPDIQGKDYMMPDSVVEVQPTRPSGGTVVWAWHVWDHLIQGFDAGKSHYGVVADHPERIDVNGWVENGSMIMPFWNHMNSITYNPALDQIVLSVRGNSELWVLDHSTTSAEAAGHTGGRSGKGGDLLYRWGNPVTYDAPGSQMLFDQHDAQWIASDCPGAGNMLIFNNGLGRNYSSVDEIAPPAIDTNGNYALVAGQAYAPSALQWTYTATPAASMYSEAISGCQRLPNGNTLVCDGTHGELREVSATGQIVWFYTCPVENTGPMTQGDTPSLDIRNHQYNAVFKVRRYPAAYAGLQGKDLTPRGTIERYPGETVDADMDTMADTWELALFGSTTNAGALTDSDGDDLTDLDEYRRGVRPDLADTDGDSAPDGWEVANALNPAFADDGLLDSDNDGMRNADEYLADTGPWNPLSRLAIMDLEAVSADMHLTWIGGARAQQRLECSSNLASGQWSAIFTNLPPTDTTNSVIHTGAATGHNRFYRIQATRAP